MTPRPTYNDAKVIEKFGKMLLPRLAAWSEQTEEDWADTISYIANEVRFLNDGFKIAKAVDDKYMVEANSEFAELMDDACGMLTDAIEQTVKEWVKENNIICPFQIGQKINYKHPWKGSVTGEVTKIHSDSAKLTLFCAEQGHVKQGSGTHGFVIFYEEAKAVE